MDWLPLFIVGWFGSVWWPGIEVDAPPPGGGGDPWWMRWVIGIVAGIAAIFVARAVAMDSNPMPGLVLGIATGCVVAKILGPLTSGIGRRG